MLSSVVITGLRETQGVYHQRVIVTDRGLLSIAVFLRLSLSVLLPPVYVSAELTVGQTAAVDDIE